MKRILIIDDSSLARRFHGSILKKRGYQVAEAEEGVEALEKSLMDRFDLILCDINMTGMDGLTFIRRFRREDHKTPIIIITTLDDELSREQGMRSGADIYLVKPVEPEKLLVHVRMMLEDET